MALTNPLFNPRLLQQQPMERMANPFQVAAAPNPFAAPVAQAQAAPQPQTGFGGGPRTAFGQFLSDNSGGLLALSASMFAGQTPQGIAAFGQQLGQNRQRKGALDYLRRNHPEYADAYAAGFLDPKTAGSLIFEQAEKPAAIREYEYAKQQGFDGSYLDFELAQKKAGATNVSQVVGQSDKFRETFDKANAEMFSGLIKDGYNAQRSMVQINRLDQLLSNVQTGGGAAMKQIAGNFGIATEGLDEIQAAQAIINQLVPEQRPPGSGPMSDADLELFKQSLPRIINQPGGNAMIIQTMRGIAEYQQQQGQIAQQVESGQLTPSQGMAALSQLQNPLDWIRTASAGTGSGAGDGRVFEYDPATGRIQ